VNEKQIGKLADYAAENPDRIPLIVSKLEERGAKEAQAGKGGSTAVPAVVQVLLQADCRVRGSHVRHCQQRTLLRLCCYRFPACIHRNIPPCQCK